MDKVNNSGFSKLSHNDSNANSNLNNNINTFREKKMHEIKNQKLKFTNNLFRIYEGEINENKSEDVSKKIILLEFKFLNFDRIHEVIINIKNSKCESGLKRLGYVYIKEDLVFYLVYELGKSVIFEVNKMRPYNKKVIKMFIFKNLLTHVENQLKSNNKIGIMHPNLIVFTPGKDFPFNFLDLCFDEVLKTVDLEFNFHLINYFGHFSFEDLTENNIEFKMKKSSKMMVVKNPIDDMKYFKSDKLSLLAILAYLFSNLSTNVEDVSYDTVLNELQQDFFNEDNEFRYIGAIILTGDDDIKNYIKKYLRSSKDSTISKSDYLEMKTSFSEIMKKVMETNSTCTCRDCEDKIGGDDTFSKDKEINTICLDVLCKFHLKKHKDNFNCVEIQEFEKEKNNEKSQSNQNSISNNSSLIMNKIKNIKERTQKIPKLEVKKIVDYFDSSIKGVFDSINGQQTKIEKMIEQREIRLNDILYYVNNLLDDRNEKSHEKMTEEIRTFDNKVQEIFNNINKREESLIKKYNKEKENEERINVISSKGGSTKKVEEVKTDEKEAIKKKKEVLEKKKELKRQIEKFTSEQIVSTKDELDATNQEINNKITEYQKFLQMSVEMKNAINYNNTVTYSLDSILKRANEYIEELVKFTDKKVYSRDYGTELLKSDNDFTNSVNDLLTNIITLYNNSDIEHLRNDDNLLEEFSGTNDYHKYVCCLDLNNKDQTKSQKTNKWSIKNKALNVIRLYNYDHSIKDVNFNKGFIVPIDFQTPLVDDFRNEYPFSHTQCVLEFCRWLNLKTRLIVTGGIVKDSNNTRSRVSYFIDYRGVIDVINENIGKAEKDEDEKEDKADNPNSVCVTFIEPMIYPRDNHSICKINDFSVIVVGGSQTDTCEVYNILTGKWEKQKSLNKIRFCGTLFLHNEIDLYLIYGLEEIEYNGQIHKVFSDKIEKLEVFCEDNTDDTWEYVNFTQVNFKIDKLCLSSMVPLSSNEIYLVGGKLPGDNEYTEKTYRFNFDTKEIFFDGKMLHSKICFLESNFLKISDNEFALFSTDFKFIKLKKA